MRSGEKQPGVAARRTKSGSGHRMFRRRWAEESTNRTVQASHSFEGMKYILPETRSESTDKPSTSLLETSLFQLDFSAFLRGRT